MVVREAGSPLTHAPEQLVFPKELEEQRRQTSIPQRDSQPNIEHACSHARLMEGEEGKRSSVPPACVAGS